MRLNRAVDVDVGRLRLSLGLAAKEVPGGVGGAPEWVGVGYIISEGSGVLLLVAGSSRDSRSAAVA